MDFCWAGKEPGCPWTRVLGSVATEAGAGCLGLLSDHWAGQLKEAAATPLPWALGGRRGHGESGQDRCAGGAPCHQAGAGTVAVATTARPGAQGREQQQIAFCRSF